VAAYGLIRAPQSLRGEKQGDHPQTVSNARLVSIHLAMPIEHENPSLALLLDMTKDFVHDADKGLGCIDHDAIAG
jgi:hypothetical protein